MTVFYKVKITKNDGFHVHIEVKGIPEENLIIAWLGVEKIILKCFPKHRRGKSHCAPLLEKGWSSYIAKYYHLCLEKARKHHASFSTHYYSSRTTVEFRIAEGTNDKEVIRNWILFCQNFIKYAETVDIAKILATRNLMNLDNIEWLIKELNISDQLLQGWLRSRFEQFS